MKIAKNIIFIVESKVPSNSAMYSRIINYAKALRDRNREVYIFPLYNSLSKNFPQLYKLDENIHLICSNFKYVKERNFYIRGFQILKYYYLFIKFLKLKDIKPSIILFQNNTIFFEICSLLFLRFIYKINIYVEVNELRKAIPLNMLLSKNNKFKWLLFKFIIIPFRLLRAKFQERLTKFYSGIIVITTKLEEYYRKYNSNITRIPILVEYEKFNNITKLKNGKSKTFLIGFFGSISIKKEGLDDLLESLFMVKKESNKLFELHLYGGQSKMGEIILDKLIDRYNLNLNIKLNGFIDYNKIPHFMIKYDLLVLTRPLNLQTEYGFSTKLGEYLASGVPVLASNVGDNHLYLEDNHNCFLVEPGDCKEISNIIIKLLHNYKKYSYIGKNGRKTAMKDFYYKKYSSKLNELIK